MRGIRREMGKTMTQSLRIPHLGLLDDVRVDALHDLVQRRKAKQPDFTMLPLLIKAVSLALSDFPEMNAFVADADASELVVHSSHTIGVAVDSPRGLVVPSIKSVESKSVMDILADLARLKRLATDGKLAPSDFASPTFSISNIGPVGGTYGLPVIAPPQVAMMAIGRTKRVPVFTAEANARGTLEIEAARLLPVSWAADHRVLDGATVARCAQRFKELVENPLDALLTLR